MYKHLSTAILTTNVTILLGFLARQHDGLDIPVTIFRISLLVASIALAIWDKSSNNRRLYIAVAAGINLGSLVAYWDELYLLHRFRFAETFLIPVVLIVLLVPVISSIFAQSNVNKTRNHSSNNWF